MSQGTDQLASDPSENAGHGADDLTLDDIAANGFEDGEEGEESDEIDETEGDESEVEGEDDETEDKPTAKRKLKVGDEELDEDEVVSGYMRQRDYTRKTEEVAAQRREVEQVRQQVAAEREERANVLDVLIGSLHQELLGVDQARLNQLLDSDPKAYLKAKEHIEAKTHMIRNAIQHRLELQKQAAQEQARDMAEYEREQRTILADKLPQWRDPKRAAAEAREIEAVLRSAGYKDDELSQLADHRAVLIARKAMLYDKLMATKGQKAPATPPAAQVRPGAANPTNQQAIRTKRAADRLRSNPNSLDALSAFVGANG